MTKKMFAALAFAVLTTTFVAEAKKNKSFCSVTTQLLRVCGLATFNGGLTASCPVSLPACTTVGGIALPSAVQSIMPFSSGILTLADLTGAVFPAAGVVMGFGNSSILPGVTTIAPVTESGFAFNVPHAGTLSNLQVSVDPIYPIGGLVSTAYPFTFTVYHSSCATGALTTYTATALTATATVTSPDTIAVLVQGTAGCGASAAGVSVAVAAGDRITIVVTSPSAPILAANIATLAFSAGMMYFPA